MIVNVLTEEVLNRNTSKFESTRSKAKVILDMKECLRETRSPSILKPDGNVVLGPGLPGRGTSALQRI